MGRDEHRGCASPGYTVIPADDRFTRSCTDCGSTGVAQYVYIPPLRNSSPQTLMSALSGIVIALWDIKGKVLGVPVWQLLGGKVRERCNVYGW